MGDIIITNEKDLERKKAAMKKEGASKFHVLSDFDRTLTTAFVNGEKRPSLISVLRDGNYLTPDYTARAHALFDKYHPIEIDPNIPLEEKKKAMKEWWGTHFELLLKSGLSRRDLEKVINSEKVKLRDGVSEFLDVLHQREIPLVILSSTGLGGDAIALYLEHAGRMYGNVYVIANFFRWNKEGRAVDYSKPIIHGMNKDETVLRKFPKIKRAVSGRRNVLLLGDSLGDPGMIEGFDYDNLIKVGFLNEEIEKNLPAYIMEFDVVVTGDGNFNAVNEILREIVGK